MLPAALHHRRLDADFVASDGGAGGEHEVAYAVDEPGTVKAGERVTGVVAIVAVTNDLIHRPGALLLGVKEPEQDAPLDTVLLFAGSGCRLIVRHGSYYLLCRGFGAGYSPRRSRLIDSPTLRV